VALSLYLDDCSNSDLFADLLRQAGHRVVRPTDPGVDLDGEDDDLHLAFAAAQRLTIVTKNPGDFLELHDAGQPHHGILAVYQDNDLTRDMSDAEIVKAIANLEQAAQGGGDPVPGLFHNLNLWRFWPQSKSVPELFPAACGAGKSSGTDLLTKQVRP
jgi:hypothetical protein